MSRATLPALPSDVLLLLALRLPLPALLALSACSRGLRAQLKCNRGFGARWLREHAAEIDAEVRLERDVGWGDLLDFGWLDDGRAFVRHETIHDPLSDDADPLEDLSDTLAGTYLHPIPIPSRPRTTTTVHAFRLLPSGRVFHQRLPTTRCSLPTLPPSPTAGDFGAHKPRCGSCARLPAAGVEWRVDKGFRCFFPDWEDRFAFEFPRGGRLEVVVGAGARRTEWAPGSWTASEGGEGGKGMPLVVKRAGTRWRRRQAEALERWFCL